ncbi:hypothetical protein [Marinimicrobium sp. C2-29]|uniref:hypothetical protein n=1 Tax=Marinimicrobium sp. C2-29 TaxID=3139825 RepID=UPI0031392E6F
MAVKHTPTGIVHQGSKGGPLAADTTPKNMPVIGFSRHSVSPATRTAVRINHTNPRQSDIYDGPTTAQSSHHVPDLKIML